jgi:hypothetical protein
MAKRSLGELNDDQRRVLQVWAEHMGVGERQMVNMLNSVDNHKPVSPWTNLDSMARVIHDCPDC